MSRIIIGKAGSRAVAINLNVLLRTRLLVQANSGGGKSWLLRRLAEQLFGKVQVIIIDPEGEFASLREKLGFVLVGPGGEISADVRLAEITARRLLELRVSAVCDLYEMKESDQHLWVKLFLNALIKSPKKLWHPMVLILDEASDFCPEGKAGDSEASKAVSSFSRKGRKRGFCAVLATQSLATLDKKTSRHLHNRLIGPTFEDVDIDRAIDLLSISASDKKDFARSIRTMEPGFFYALGRAISKERILLEVGSVSTTHPDIGRSKMMLKPPPAPSKIRGLLPKLADLPKEAQQEAQTAADFHKEIRSLKAQLRAQPAAAGKTVVERVVDQTGIDKTIQLAVRRNNFHWQKQLAESQRKAQHIAGILKKVAATLTIEANKIANLAEHKVEPPPWPKTVIPRTVLTRRPTPAPAPAPTAQLEGAGLDGVGQSQLKILRALSEFEAIGRNGPSRESLAFWAEARPTSGGYKNNLGALRTAGLIEYPAAGTVGLTSKGRQGIGLQDPPTTQDVRDRIMRLLSKAQGHLLEILLDIHPQAIGRAELAERAGVPESSGGFKNNLGALRTAGLIEYPSGGQTMCADWLFIE